MVGLAVDFGGSFVTGLVLMTAYAYWRMGVDADFVDGLAAFSEDPTMFVTGALTGSLFSAWGGYLCARIARRREYRPVGVMTTISVALGAWLGSGQYAAGESVGLAIVTTLAILVGARLGRVRNRGTPS
jgi:nitrate/nitrite transporter NarK